MRVGNFSAAAFVIAFVLARNAEEAFRQSLMLSDDGILIFEQIKKKRSFLCIGLDVDIKKITTKGDTKIDIRLSEIGGKGLFSKNIEEELLKKNIDIAVHALKDLPSFETKGLKTNCFLKRNSSNEVLISNSKKKLKDLVPGSIIGTSSFRREFQLRNIRKDLNFKLIRGNIDTRIKKLKNIAGRVLIKNK